tara:strand:+ start:126 stop:500 length:375 start_codon:yes stop_codon:yes gene_type:complete
MENYLYFADGDGADATGDAAMWPMSRFIGVDPVSVTTTDIYFEGQTGVGDGVDKVRLTHLNSSTVLDDQADLNGHKCQQIANAIASLFKAHPHGGVMHTVVDLTNSVTAAGMPTISAVAITIDS